MYEKNESVDQKCTQIGRKKSKARLEEIKTSKDEALTRTVTQWKGACLNSPRTRVVLSITN